MSKLRNIGEGISQKVPEMDGINCPILFKKDGKYYRDNDYKTELRPEQVKDRAVIQFKMSAKKIEDVVGK